MHTIKTSFAKIKDIVGESISQADTSFSTKHFSLVFEHSDADIAFDAYEDLIGSGVKASISSLKSGIMIVGDAT